MADLEIVIRKRTIRRQQRAEILTDLLHDIDIVERRRDSTLSHMEYLAMCKLHEILYAAYCDVVDSEV